MTRFHCASHDNGQVVVVAEQQIQHKHELLEAVSAGNDQKFILLVALGLNCFENAKNGCECELSTGTNFQIHHVELQNMKKQT